MRRIEDRYGQNPSVSDSPRELEMEGGAIAGKDVEWIGQLSSLPQGGNPILRRSRYHGRQGCTR